MPVMIWALVLILLLGAFPLGSVRPCVALGLDFGGLLYPMAVGGWFVMFTIPLAGLALIVWLVVLVVSLFMRRHR